jgi:SAM-dependent methyltransferase
MRLHGLNADLACRDFSQRSRETEWLDQANLDSEELRRVLRDLARFNGAMLGHLPVLRWLRKAVTSVAQNGSLSLLDVGCGYGDLLRAIHSWAGRYGITIALRGVDINAHAVRGARDATDPSHAIDYQVADIFQLQSTEPIDLIVSSLFAHHLTDDEIVDFVKWMERRASRGWLICDLQRHQVPHFFIGIAGRLSRLHPVVFRDGQISVRRALTRSEWEKRLCAARIPSEGVAIRSFLFRYAIGRLR